MSTITRYVVTQDPDNWGDEYQYDDPREARELAMRTGACLLEVEYEYSDTSLAEDFGPVHSLVGTEDPLCGAEKIVGEVLRFADDDDDVTCNACREKMYADVIAERAATSGPLAVSAELFKKFGCVHCGHNRGTNPMPGGGFSICPTTMRQISITRTADLLYSATSSITSPIQA